MKIKHEMTVKEALALFDNFEVWTLITEERVAGTVLAEELRKAQVKIDELYAMARWL